MKKVLLMFAFIATLLVGSIGTAGAQVNYTVYDGTGTSTYVPVEGLYTDSRLKCEYVIPADHLTAINGSTISKLTYYLTSSASAAWTCNFQVFVKEVASPTISDFSGMEDATLVYEGTLDATSSTMEMEVVFSTPYTYNGGNLLIGFYNTNTGNYKSATFAGQTITGASVQGHNSNFSSITATQKNFIPKTTFTVDELHGCLTPTNLAVSDVATYGATVTWTPGNTETDWVVKFNDDEYPVSGTPSYTVTGLTPNTSYVASVKAVCGGTEESEYTTPGVLFTTLPTCPAPTAVTFSNITTTSVDVAWTENGPANAWTIEANGTEYAADSNPFTLNGLNPSTNYTVKVKANCSEEDESDWSATATFATACGAIALTETTPYSENFDSYTATSQNSANGVIPICWGTISNGTNANTLPRVCTSYVPISGSKGLNFRSGGTTYQNCGTINIAYLPEITNPQGAVVAFAYKMENTSNGTLSVGYVTDLNDVTSFVSAVSVTSSTSAANSEVIIPTTIPAGARIAFQWEETSASYYDCGIDNLVVSMAPDCAKPTAVTVSNVTAHTAEVAWTNGSEESAWTIDYNGTEIAADSNPFTLTGLDAATNYTVKVKANCSEESESEWSTIVNFLTECETNTTFPYVQDFEATTFPPTCWFQTRLAGSATTTNYANGAWARYGYSNGSNTTAQAQLRDDRAGNLHQLITGAQNFTYEGGYILSVDVYRNTSSYATEGIRIYVNNEPTVNENATELAFISRNYTVASTVNSGIVGAETASGWYTYELPITATGVNYIIFQGESQYGSSTYMDNVRIGEAPTCPKPTGVTVSNVTARTADIAWTENGTASVWTIDYNGTEITADSNPFTLTGLTPETSYTVKVKANCSEESESDWSTTASFTTLVSCPAPSALTITGLTENSAEISWTAGDENSWVIEYNDMTEVITSNPYTLTGLTAETNYDVRIRAICAENDSSAWSSTLAVYTGMCVPAPTSVDGNGIVNVTFGTNQIVNNATHPTEAPYYGDYTSMVGDVAAGLNANVDITFNTCGYSCYGYGTVIWVNWNNDLAFTDDEVVFTGQSAEVANAVLSCSFPVPANTPAGEYRMRIGAADSYFDDAIEDGEGFNPCSSSTYTVYEDYTLSVTEAPDCMPVTNVTINNITAHSAEISWTSQGNENAWEIEYNGTTEVITTNPYSLTGLDAATDYSVRVRSICSETDTSIWSAAAVFTTECDNITTFPYVQDFESTMFPPICWFQERTNAGTSSYGTEYPDGAWTQNASIQNGNATGKAQLRDTRAGSVHALVTGSMDFTYENGYILSVDVCRNATGTSYLNEGIRIFVNSEPEVNTNATELAFISRNYTVASTVNSDIVGAETASGWYTYELPITATGVNYIIFQGESQYGSSTYMDNVIVDETPTCAKPTAVTVSNITETTADIAWTENGTAEEWTIEYNGTEVSATTNPFTLTGLDASTLYTVKVKAICSEEDESDWSNEVSFRTECAAVAIPFYESFEDGEFGCWTIEESNTSYTWHTVSTLGSGYTGGMADGQYAAAMTCSTYDGHTAKLISPVLDLSTTMFPSLTFSYLNASWSPDQNVLSVYYRTDANAEWTLLETYNSNVTSWTEETISLPNPTATYQIAFEGTALYGRNIHVDAISVEGTSCPAPTNVVVSNETETSADVNWTAGYEETAWNIRYREIPEAAVYDFEDGMQGWTTLNTDGDEYVFVHSSENIGEYDYTSFGHNGSNGFAVSNSYIDYVGEVNANQYLVAPNAITVDSVTSLNFYYDYGNDDYTDYFEAGIFTQDPTDTTNFTSLWNSQDRGAANTNRSTVRHTERTRYNNWREVTIDLSEYAGQQVWIAFHHQDYDNFELWLDDITIGELPSEWTVVEGVTNPYTITGLTANTTYEVQVQAACSEDDASAWTASVEFTTLGDSSVVEPCEVPANIAVEHNVVTWESEAENFNLMYIVANDTTTVQVAGNTYTVEGLEEGTVVTVMVQAICDENNVSDWSEATEFTFEGVGINNYGLNANVYPNPTHDVVNVECSAIGADLSVYDMFGKVVMNTTIQSERTELNLSNVAPGVYMIRIANNNAITTVKVVKE